MSFPDIFAFLKNPTKQQKGLKTIPKRKKWIIDPTTCFTFPEVQALLTAAEQRKRRSKSGIKDWCYVVLSLNTGLRISEVAALKCRDLILSGAAYPHVFVEKGKTENSKRRVPLNKTTIESILEYQRYKIAWGEGWHDDEPFLRSPMGEHYSRWGLFECFKRTVKSAQGIENPDRFHPHSMRHTFATFLYKASGYNLRLVQELLGHSSIRVSEVYTSVFNEDRAEAIEKIYSEKKGKKWRR
jgi:integrase